MSRPNGFSTLHEYEHHISIHEAFETVPPLPPWAKVLEVNILPEFFERFPTWLTKGRRGLSWPGKEPETDEEIFDYNLNYNG
ncbi:Uu.00g079370.m01.CDS01 [Anthostomella pinea]|uniref:Uu.00g079370.m01.CDS01 n=1 Tax=Anthostomella pinea TaxID=933095 RepID=A0AAI8YJ40_9PEZI|nr:Uu.00g079370.m01.CDS01 [Anthostomella pinea]